MRLLYYAINGTGLGHVMRLSTIARATAALDSDVHQLLATSSSYTELLQRLALPFVVLPRDDSSPFGGTDQRRATVSRWTAAAMLYQLIQGYAPRLAVFDTHFTGRLVRQLRAEGIEPVLVLRLCREAYLRSLLRDDGLSPFSLVLMPHDRDELERELPADVVEALAAHPGFRAVGPVVRPPAPAEETAALAARHGIPEGAPLILITCGSGGYRHQAEAFLQRASAAAVQLRGELPAAVVLAVGGPYGGGGAVAPGCRFVASEPDLPLLMARADLVVGHGGYNTVHEVLQAGARAVLVPMARNHESQEDRVRRLAAAGRVTALAAEAPAAEYQAAFAAALRGPRPAPQELPGAAAAARALLERLPRPRRFALGAAAPPAGWAPLAATAELLAALAGPLPPPLLLVGWQEAAALAAEPAVRARPPQSWYVDLGGGEAGELTARARRALAALDGAGEPVSLVFTDESGGARLAELCEHLAAARLEALVARVPTRLLAATAAVRFQAFEACRRRQPGFAVDVTPLEASSLAPDRV